MALKSLVRGRKHGAKNFEELAAEGDSIVQHKELFKGFRRASVHETFAEVEHWIEGQRIKSHRMLSPREAEQRAKAVAKSQAEQAAAQEAAQKAPKTPQKPAKPAAVKPPTVKHPTKDE